MKSYQLYLLPCTILGLFLAGCSKDDGTSAGGGKSVPNPEEAILLKPKLDVGTRHVHRMEVDQTSETKLPQRPEPMKQKVDMVQEYSLSIMKDREGGGKEVDMEYLATQMDVVINGRPVLSFDSTGESLADEKNPMIAVFRKLIGQKLKIYFDEKYEVEKVEGVEAFMEALSKDTPAQARGVMAGMFNEETFKQMADFNKALPKHPVKLGDTWSITNQVVMGPMGKMSVVMNYTFAQWEQHDERHCARLDFDGTVSSDGSGTGPMGMNMKIDKGTLLGKSWFDPEKGVLVDNDIEQKMSLTMVMKIPRLNDKGGGEQNITTTLRQKISLQLVEEGQVAVP